MKLKIALPTEGSCGLEEIVSDHFGRCKSYTILDEDGSLLEIIENKSSHFGGKLLPPDFMKENGIDVLLCKGIGHKALIMCQNLNIKVLIGNSFKVMDFFKEYQKGTLVEVNEDNVCKGH